MRSLATALLMIASVGTGTAHARDIEKEPLPEVYSSAWSLVRGGAGLAVADNEDALFMNPANLALYDKPPLAKTPFVRFTTFEENINKRPDDGLYKRVVLASPQAEVSETGYSLWKRTAGTDVDPVELAREVLGKNVRVGASNFSGVLLRRFGVGVFTTARADALVFKNADYGGLEAAAARAEAYAGATAGVAESFAKDRILVGVAYRFHRRGYGQVITSPSQSAEELRESLTTGEYAGRGDGRAIDAGLTLRTSPLKVSGGTMRFWTAATVRDASGTAVKPAESPSPDLDIRQTVHAGFGADLTLRDQYLRFMADYLDLTNAYDLLPVSRTRLGTELWLSGTFGITGGLRDGYAAGGFFLDLSLFRLDAGTYAEEAGRFSGAREDRRYVVRVAVGL